MTVLSPAQRRALDLSRSTLVRAGAGSGKTTLLVARCCALFEQAEPPESSQVLLLTFTEKAAAEMSARMRAARLGRPEVSTIHAFAAGLIRQYGAPPERRLQDAGQQRQRLVALLETELLRIEWEQPKLLEPLSDFFGRGSLLRLLRGLFEQRVIARDWASRVMRHRTAEAYEAHCLSERDQIRRRLATEIRRDPAWDRLVERIRDRSGCHRALADHLACLEHALEASAILTGGTPGSMRRHLDELLRLVDRSKGVWRSAPEVSARFGPTVLDFRELITRRRPALELEQVEERFARAEFHFARLWSVLTMAYQREQRREGVLDFDDLVPNALRCLKRPEVGDAVRARYRFILVDEFQDTDREQWAMIRRLAAEPDDPLPAGKLFLVGDEKQSIYRFRGADVSVFNAVPSEFDTVELSENFRSRAGVLNVLNDTFDKVLAAEGADWSPYEARPQRLLPGREEQAVGGSVRLLVTPLGSPPPPEDLSAARLLDGPSAREAASIARELRSRAAEGRYYEEMAVLLRTRQLLPALRHAFEAFGLPYVVWRGSGFYQSQEVRDLVGLLTCLAEPGDQVALAGVLRSPLIGMSDVGLFHLWRGGGLGVSADLGEGFLGRCDAFAAGLARRLLDRGRRLIGHVPVAEVLRELLDESGAMSSYREGADGEQAVANIEKLLGIIRSLDQGRGIHAVREVLEGLIAAGHPEGMAPLDLSEQRGVRLMTVHAAKGLQFPVVVVAGLARPVRPAGASLVVERHPELGPRAVVSLPGEPAMLRQLFGARRDAMERAEGKRLLYVACTRAQEELILSAALRETEDGFVSPTEGGRIWEWWSLLGAAWDVGEILPLDAALPGVELVRGNPELPAVPALAGEIQPPRLEVPRPPSHRAPPTVKADALHRFAECPRRYYYGSVLGMTESGSLPAQGLPFRVSQDDAWVEGHLDPPTVERLRDILGSALLARAVEASRQARFPASERPPCDSCGFGDGVCDQRRFTIG